MFSHVFVSHSVQGEWVSLVPGPFWTWISLVGMSPGWVGMSRGGGWVCMSGGGYVQGWVWLEVGMSGGWVCPGGGGYVHGGGSGYPPPWTWDTMGYGRLVGGMHPT